MLTPPPRPVRVTFVIQKLAGLSGGAERVLIDTARDLAGRGMQVRIWTFDRHASAPGYAPDPVPVRNLFPYPKTAKGAARGGYARRSRAESAMKAMPHHLGVNHLKFALTHGVFARCLRAALRDDPPDVVVGFMPPAITAVATAIGGLHRSSRPAMIASTHNLPGADFDDGSPRWDQNPVYRARARAALAQARAITILQPEFADWFPPALRSRLVVMPNAVERLTPVMEPHVTREPVFLAVGRLSPVKQHDLLVEAFARIADRWPDWRVVICGEGGERAALAARIAAHHLDDRIQLAGSVSAIGQHYDRSAVLCHPSRFEGFGLSVAEAMVHGLPVIAFADCPGIRDLIKDNVDGLLLMPAYTSDAARISSLTAAMDRMARDRALRNRLGAQATAIADRFAPDRIGQLWAALIDACHAGTNGTDRR